MVKSNKPLIMKSDKSAMHVLVKALPRVQYGKNSTRPSLSTIFSMLHSWQCFNWFIVLAGLFKKIAKVLLGAIEQQVTRKVFSLALADHSKAICSR